jgi:hypothetical protein
MFNIHVYFQFVQIRFIYFSYLFLIRSPGPPCLQINAHDAYDVRFRCSLYASPKISLQATQALVIKGLLVKEAS